VWDIVIGVSCVILVMALRYLKTHVQSWNDSDRHKSRRQIVARKFLWFIATGRNALVVVVAALIGGVLVSQNLGDKIKLVKNVKEGLPPIINPMATSNYSFKDAMSYLDASLAVVPLIGFLEAISIAQAFARENSYRVDASQELIALGVSNVLGSFVKAYPATGSFSRTAVNSQSGVRTPAGGIITGGVVLLALAFLTPLFYYIPQAALAAIIITAVLHMVNVRILLQIWKINCLELIPWLVCFAGTLFLGIKYGVLIATGFHLIFPLYKLVFPSTSYTKRGNVGILVLNSLITYPGFDRVKTILHEWEDKSRTEGCLVSVFVLDCGQMLEIDFTVIQVIFCLYYVVVIHI
jgi:sodium-independent sulfate anion transporter 11